MIRFLKRICFAANAGFSGFGPVGLAFALVLGGVWVQADFQGSTHLVAVDEEPIHYGKSQAEDSVARLQKKIDSGEVVLRRDEKFGYYPAVLEQLKIAPSSQVLVFSKTSFQRDRISPGAPRAIYFNDDVYLGFVAGSPIMELSTADPNLGGVFYTLDQSAAGRPKFVRNDQCLECHHSARSMGVPGHLVRSFFTDESGQPDLNTGVSQVNHRTPFSERWGGWYVSGRHGAQTHRGNLVGDRDVERNAKEPNFRANVDDLKAFIETRGYMRDTSDVAALMVLEHQAHMHNFITRLNHDARIALSQYNHVRYLKTPCEAFLKYLLFVEEAALTSPVRGSKEFAEAFMAAGPRDAKGRSLRELDLQTRMFKYPCSYLIYSEAFDRIPGPLKDHLYARLLDILTGNNAGPGYERLSSESRLAILEILAETKKDLPAVWHDAVVKARKRSAPDAR